MYNIITGVHSHGRDCCLLFCAVVSFGIFLRLFNGGRAVVLVRGDEGPSSSDCTSPSDELISLGSALSMV